MNNLKQQLIYHIRKHSCGASLLCTYQLSPCTQTWAPALEPLSSHLEPATGTIASQICFSLVLSAVVKGSSPRLSAALPGAMPGCTLDSVTDYRPNHFTCILSFPHTSSSIFILTATAQSASRAVTESLVLPKTKPALLGLHLLLDLLRTTRRAPARGGCSCLAPLCSEPTTLN